MHTRERILQAAAEMLAEDVTTTLSVRAVAARAGVSTGSLRFHFPTQRALQDEVLTRIYRHFIPDEPIHDVSRPARDRLVDCLRQVLAAAGVGDEARAAWAAAYENFIAPEPSAKIRTAYLAQERVAAQRVEYWLGVLANEGASSRGFRAQGAFPTDRSQRPVGATRAAVRRIGAAGRNRDPLPGRRRRARNRDAVIQIFSASMRSCGTTENVRPVGRSPAPISRSDNSSADRSRRRRAGSTCGDRLTGRTDSGNCAAEGTRSPPVDCREACSPPPR